ncbi:MAG: response regulator [Cyclobacteriaceae bacterium]
MIVDDNAAVSTNLQTRINHHEGLQFLSSFVRPLAALEYLANANPVPDIIFLDYEMPELMGDEFLEKLDEVLLARQHKECPVVIYISAHANLAADLMHSHRHVYSFIRKPITAKHFLDTISKINDIKSLTSITPPKSNKQAFSISNTKKRAYQLQIKENNLKIKYHHHRKTMMASIPIRDIVQVISLGKKVEVRVKKEQIESHIHYGSIQAYRDLFRNSSNKFQMLNRCHLVNTDQIKFVNGKTVTLTDESIIQTSLTQGKLFKTL